MPILLFVLFISVAHAEPEYISSQQNHIVPPAPQARPVVPQTAYPMPTFETTPLYRTDDNKPATTSQPDSRTAALPARLKVLIIGDSHSVGRFGSQLYTRFASLPSVEAVSYASCGSSASSWFNHWRTNCGYIARPSMAHASRSGKTPYIPDVVNHFEPNIVVVELGGNAVRQSEATFNESIRQFKLAMDSKNITCFWAGPPSADPAKAPAARAGAGLELFYRKLQLALGNRCTFFDSRPHTPYTATGRDGVHFGGPEGIAVVTSWANAYFTSVISTLCNGNNSEPVPAYCQPQSQRNMFNLFSSGF